MTAAVVVAAGSGQRFGGAVAKQFLPLNGRTVLECALQPFVDSAAIGQIVLVVAADQLQHPIVEELKQRFELTVVAGGATRAESALAGVRAVEEAIPTVLVHDAARPWLTTALIERVAAATAEHGAAVPTLPVADTVKSLHDNGTVDETLDRSKLGLAQTPQGGRREAMIDALQQALARGETATDEAAALEWAGHTVIAVEGEASNRKLTTRDDWKESSMDLRVGNGFDIHRVDASRPLVLGGVHFEGEAGLEGHSDADVVLHAAMDAVLGAAGQGDIGQWFPPSDDQWKGADSWQLSRRVLEIVREQGFSIVNLDLMVLAEKPKIGPRLEAMKQRIAEAFEIGIDRVGLKATTLETLGALGRHEGIACQAVVLLRRD